LERRTEEDACNGCCCCEEKEGEREKLFLPSFLPSIALALAYY
jgi:hypothetical protein